MKSSRNTSNTGAPAKCWVTMDGEEKMKQLIGTLSVPNTLMAEAADKLDELRAERDSARANLAALQKCVDNADLAQLFDDLIEFLDDQADADGDSEGFYPNKAMRLSSAVSSAARAFGWEA